MQWVAERDLALVVTLVALVTGSALYFAQDESPLPSKSLVLTCFDSATTTLESTSATNCDPQTISLGSGKLEESATATGEVVAANPLLLARFKAAQAFAALDGVRLYITSGFRSFERQGELFASAIEKYGSESEAAKWVLPPYYSHHPRGLALDVNYPGDPQGALWLEKNGAQFGLCRVYANEWWHFEGVIAPGGICPKMAENALVDMPDSASIS